MFHSIFVHLKRINYRVFTHESPKWRLIVKYKCTVFSRYIISVHSKILIFRKQKYKFQWQRAHVIPITYKRFILAFTFRWKFLFNLMQTIIIIIFSFFHIFILKIIDDRIRSGSFSWNGIGTRKGFYEFGTVYTHKEKNRQTFVYFYFLGGTSSDET